MVGMSRSHVIYRDRKRTKPNVIFFLNFFIWGVLFSIYPSYLLYNSSLFRMIPVPYGIITHSARRLKYASRLRPLLVPKSLHTKSAPRVKTQTRNLRVYTGYAIALGLVSLNIYWIIYPSDRTKPTTLDERRFQPFAIISKELVSPTSFIFTLRPSSEPPSDPYAHLWAQGVWSVEFKQPQLQIARSYTPLPPTDFCVPGDLRFLIRREHNGEVSRYLDRLRIGAIVEIRGPRLEYEIPQNVSDVLFLAGGTGIAPALQVISTLLYARLGNRRVHEMPNIHILWANRRREDCIGGRRAVKNSWRNWWNSTSSTITDGLPNRIVQELQELEKKYEGKVRVDYMVDEEGSSIGKIDILKITGGSPKSDSADDAAPPGTKLLFISGPEGFIEFCAGPRELENGKLVQGRLGGILGGLKIDGWMVVKL